MSNEKPVTPISVSNQRRERARKSGKSLSVVFWLFVSISIGGGLWYYTQVYAPNRDRELYDQDTIRLSKEASAGVSQLSEWSTQASLDSHAVAVKELADRERVQDSLVSGLEETVERLLKARADRMSRYEALLAEATRFPLNSSRDEVAAFDARILEARSAFEKKLSGELRSQWTLRRKDIASQIKSSGEPGQLTIRTDPSKADVFMDGRLLAVSPFTVAQVRPGEHLLLIKKEGYRDKQISMTMEIAGNLDLGIQELEAIAGSLEIRVTGGKKKDRIEVEIEEASAPMSVGGLEVVQGYQYMIGRQHSLESLRIGEYAIIVIQNGTEAARETFVVEENEMTQVLVKL